jgi:SAM-dependent methyltransferase
MDVEAQRRSLAATFDGVAALYDAVRPRHPEALIEHVVETAQLAPAARVLEIGAGPGIATLPFARRGFEMVCLEPGAALAAHCRENLAPYSRVVVLDTSFEAWPVEPAGFDLVMAAQAFHWTDPATAYHRVAEALRPLGWLAIFGNMPLAPPDEPIFAAVNAAYREHAPALAEWRAGKGHGHGDYLERIAQSGHFEAPELHSFPWTARYETDRYLQLLQTQSDHRSLPAQQREALLGAIGAAVETHGGGYEVRYEARLWMARRSA